MPTGYTADITDATTFPQFAMRCARAFGALILMRDDPQDAPIPQRLMVSDYYPKAVADAEARVAELRDMDEAAADRRSQAEFDAEKVSRAQSRAKDAVLLANYNRMLTAVRAWVPPTPDHEGMRDFMIEQLESSIKFDCHTDADREKWEPKLIRLDAKTWRALRISDAERALEGARTSLQEEEARMAMRNAWLSALRASLLPPPNP